MKQIEFKTTFLMFAIVLTGLFACSNDQKSSDGDNQEKVEITLNSSDEMRYDKSEIIVSEGQTVVLTLNHTGKLPVTSMGHNFVLLAEGTVVADFAVAAMSEKDNNYIPADENGIIAHTKIIGGGESDTITFTAPEKGTYDFICSFPGHYAVMKGKFIVQ